MVERFDREERSERMERYDRGERHERSSRNEQGKGPSQGSGFPAQHARDDEAYCRDLLELQRTDFALVELTLYLDTHPADMQAVQQFNQLSQRRRQIASEFEMKYGPLLQFGLSYSRFPWQWIETPWPWQV
jgi:spore coat protein JB